jgi:hypothetical protein
VIGRALALAVTLTLAACDRTPSFASCADNLTGVYVDPANRRWSLLDHGPHGLEIYPAFADNDPPMGTPPDVELAPRMITLHRTGTGAATALGGVVRRRFMRGDTQCPSVVTAHGGACRGTTLELAVPEPPAPTMFTPCAFPDVAPAPPARWTWQAPLR